MQAGMIVSISSNEINSKELQFIEREVITFYYIDVVYIYIYIDNVKLFKLLVLFDDFVFVYFTVFISISQFSRMLAFLRTVKRSILFSSPPPRSALFLNSLFSSFAPAQKESPASVTGTIRPTTFDSGGSRCFPSVRQSFRS